jgi:hypothetical protein
LEPQLLAIVHNSPWFYGIGNEATPKSHLLHPTVLVVSSKLDNKIRNKCNNMQYFQVPIKLLKGEEETLLKKLQQDLVVLY